MVVELWYLVTVRERYAAEGGKIGASDAPGSTQKAHLLIDSTERPLDLRQISTMGNPRTRPDRVKLEHYEPVRHLVEVATTHELWKDDDEQAFWEQWVMYPELPAEKHAWALGTIRAMLTECGYTYFQGDSLAEGSRINIFLQDGEANEVPVMELEVISPLMQSFPRIDKLADEGPPPAPPPLPENVIHINAPRLRHA